MKQGVPSVYLMPGFTSADPAINAKETSRSSCRRTITSQATICRCPWIARLPGMFLRVNRLIIESIANDSRAPTGGRETFSAIRSDDRTAPPRT